MTITNLSMLATTVHGTPSGNYDGSSLNFAGDAVQAVGYYRSPNAIQTVRYQLDNFQGILKFQGTLNDDEKSWFDVYEVDSSLAPTSDLQGISLTGKFAFMRVAVEDFVGGTIEFVNISY